MSNVRTRLDQMEPTDGDLAEDQTGRLQQKYKLVEAVRALLDGKPTDAGLRTVLQKEGRVPITKNTVEIEAGVDRRRFSGPRSSHPDVSTLLKDLKPDYGVGSTATERMRKQAKTIELLQQQLVASRSATAAQAARIDALLQKLKSSEGRIQRLRKGLDEEG